MPKALPALLMLGLVAVAGCQAFDLPANQPSLQLHYPPGFVADFPHLNPGDTVTIAVQVTTNRGEPVEGVEVIWDDGFSPVAAQPQRALSASTGRVTSTWVLRSLRNGTFSAQQSIRAYLPGADNSPLEYRALVIRCTRCPVMAARHVLAAAASRRPH